MVSAMRVEGVKLLKSFVIDGTNEGERESCFLNRNLLIIIINYQLNMYLAFLLLQIGQVVTDCTTLNSALIAVDGSSLTTVSMSTIDTQDFIMAEASEVGFTKVRIANKVDAACTSPITITGIARHEGCYSLEGSEAVTMMAATITPNFGYAWWYPGMDNPRINSPTGFQSSGTQTVNGEAWIDAGGTIRPQFEILFQEEHFVTELRFKTRTDATYQETNIRQVSIQYEDTSGAIHSYTSLGGVAIFDVFDGVTVYDTNSEINISLDNPFFAQKVIISIIQPQIPWQAISGRVGVQVTMGPVSSVNECIKLGLAKSMNFVGFIGSTGTCWGSNPQNLPKGQTTGANCKSEVYSLPGTQQYKKVDCFQDNWPKDFDTVNADITSIDECLKSITGDAQYASVHNGRDCFQSNGPVGQLGFAGGTCDSKLCSASGEKCGAFYANYVHSKNSYIEQKGCSENLLPILDPLPITNTRECFELAQNAGYRYYGVRDTNKCYYGNEYDSEFDTKIDTDCATRCSYAYGADMYAQQCGGNTGQPSIRAYEIRNQIYTSLNTTDQSYTLLLNLFLMENTKFHVVGYHGPVQASGVRRILASVDFMASQEIELIKNSGQVLIHSVICDFPVNGVTETILYKETSQNLNLEAFDLIVEKIQAAIGTNDAAGFCSYSDSTILKALLNQGVITQGAEVYYMTVSYLNEDNFGFSGSNSNFQVTDPYLFSDREYSLPLRVQFVVNFPSHGEILPMFTLNKQEYGGNGADALWWHFSTTSPPSTFRIQNLDPLLTKTDVPANFLTAALSTDYLILCEIHDDHAFYSIDGALISTATYSVGDIPVKGSFGFGRFYNGQVANIKDVEIQSFGLEPFDVTDVDEERNVRLHLNQFNAEFLLKKQLDYNCSIKTHQARIQKLYQNQTQIKPISVILTFEELLQNLEIYDNGFCNDYINCLKDIDCAVVTLLDSNGEESVKNVFIQESQLVYNQNEVMPQSEFILQIESLDMIAQIILDFEVEAVEYKEVRPFINQAPFFAEMAPEKIYFSIDPLRPNYFEYTLPQIIDANSDGFSLKMYNLEEFISFSEENQTLSFFQATPGTYNLVVELTDSQLLSINETLTFEIVQQYQQEIVQQQQEEIDQQQKVEVEIQEVNELSSQVVNDTSKDIQNCTAKILKITPLGEVFIEFSTKMKIDFELTELDSSVLEIFLSPSEESLLMEDFDYTLLKFTWVASSFSDNLLKLDLTFTEPFDVSRGIIHDTLTIHINNTQHYFISAELLSDLSDDSLILSGKIQRQLIDGPIVKMLIQLTMHIKTWFAVYFVICLILDYFVAGVLNLFFGSLRQLQLVTHALMLVIIAPQNVTIFMQSILPITQFDFIEPWWTNTLVKMFQIDEDSYEIFEVNGSVVSDQFKSMGYDKSLILLLLGSIGLYFMIYLAKAFQLITIYAVLKTTGKGQKKFNKVFKSVFQNDLIALTREVYIELLIVGYFTLQFPPSQNPLGVENLSRMLGYFSLLLSVVVVPFFIIRSFTQKRARQITEGYKESQSQIAKLASVCQYFLRRLILVRLIFIKKSMQGIQIHLTLLLNMASFMYIGQVKPHDSKHENRLQIFNEVMVHVIFYHMIFFTDLVPEYETHYQIGWSMITCTLIMIAVNFIKVSRGMAKVIWWIAQKCYNRIPEGYCKRSKPVQPTNEVEVIEDRVVVIIQEDTQDFDNQSSVQAPSNIFLPENQQQQDGQQKQNFTFMKIEDDFQLEESKDHPYGDIHSAGTPKFEKMPVIPKDDFSFRPTAPSANLKKLTSIFEKYEPLLTEVQIESNLDLQQHLMDMARAGQKTEELHPNQLKRLQNEKKVRSFITDYKQKEKGMYPTDQAFFKMVSKNFEKIVESHLLAKLFIIEYTETTPRVQDEEMEVEDLQDISAAKIAALSSPGRKNLISRLCPNPSDKDIEYVSKLYEQLIKEQQEGLELRKSINSKYETKCLSKIQIMIKNYQSDIIEYI